MSSKKRCAEMERIKGAMDRREAFEITHRVRALLDVAGELRLKSIKVHGSNS